MKNQWKSMKINENQWKSNENQWKSMTNQWKPNENQWKSMLPEIPEIPESSRKLQRAPESTRELHPREHQRAPESTREESTRETQRAPVSLRELQRAPENSREQRAPESTREPREPQGAPESFREHQRAHRWKSTRIIDKSVNENQWKINEKPQRAPARNSVNGASQDIKINENRWKINEKPQRVPDSPRERQRPPESSREPHIHAQYDINRMSISIALELPLFGVARWSNF